MPIIVFAVQDVVDMSSSSSCTPSSMASLRVATTIYRSYNNKVVAVDGGNH
jgi:hypothetical protein